MNDPAAARRPSSPNAVLAMLLLVYTFNYLDRQILSILAQPVKADLGLSDAQLGALGGLAFALLYSTMAIPLSLVADRTGRARVIGIALVVWSGFTAVCGTVTGFTQLFLARLGVGIGEAGGVAPSYAVIADNFTPGQRGRALAVYSLGVPLGSAVGALFGAAIASAINWRVAFVVLGLSGLLVVLPFRMVVRDRPQAHAVAHAAPMAVFRRLAVQPVFWLMSLGAASSSLCGYGLAFWMPALLQRSFGLGLLEAGQFVGGLYLVGGTAGVLLGGMLGDRLGRGDRAGYARVPAIAWLLCAPAFALGFLTTDTAWAFALLLVPTLLSHVWLGPVIAAFQHLVPPQERATASACFLLINNGIGLGFGSLIIGRISDALTPLHGDEALRHAMIWATASYLVASVLMLLAAPRLRAAWQE